MTKKGGTKMKQKHISNKMLQKLANELSRDAFKNPYPYDIFFDDIKTASFIPLVEIPVGREDECFILLPKKLRRSSPEAFVECLIIQLNKYNRWWLGLDYNVEFLLSPVQVKYFIDVIDKIQQS